MITSRGESNGKTVGRDWDSTRVCYRLDIEEHFVT